VRRSYFGPEETWAQFVPLADAGYLRIWWLADLSDQSHVLTIETLPPELEKFWRTDDGLTACERAEAYGIDLSLSEENLRLSPEERIRQNLAASHSATLVRTGVLNAKDLHAVLELEAIREKLGSRS